MVSNPQDRAAQIAADEAERLAAQFRPAWELDDGSEPLELAEVTPPPAPLPPRPPQAPSNDVRQATMRWAPGTVPNAAGLPAPAPPVPPPAPPPAMAQPLFVAEGDGFGQQGDVPEPTSSNGEAAVAIATGPKLPPKPLDVAVTQEPSIIVAEADPNDGSRRRETVRLDALKFDPETAEMYAKRERDERAKAAKAAQSKVARTQRIIREPGKPIALAPVPSVTPDDDDVYPPRKNNRAIVIGAVAFAGLIMVLGLVKAMSGKEDEPPTDTASATATSTSTSAPRATAAAAATTTTTAAATTTTAAAPATAKADTKPADPTPNKASRVSSVAATAAPVMAAKDLPSAPATVQPTAKATAVDDGAGKPPKKPQKGGTGSIVRDAPF
jgi:hypothetical protein